MKEVGPELTRLLQELDAPACTTCCQCGKHLDGSLSIVIADADQAFEACDADSISQQWKVVADAFQARYPEGRILDRKGIEEITKAQEGGYGAGWWCLSLPEVHRALVMFTLMTVVSAAGRFYVLRCICIGGVMSSAAVAVSLGAQEYTWFSLGGHRRSGYDFGPRRPKQCISWRRYVDDVMAASRRFCSTCVL